MVEQMDILLMDFFPKRVLQVNSHPRLIQGAAPHRDAGE